MSESILRGAALVAGIAVLGMAIAGALLRILGPATPQTFNIGSPIDFVAEAAAASTYGVIGMVLARRLPRHPVPWIFLGIGLAFAGVVITWAYAIVALSQVPELPLALESILLNTAVVQPVGLALLVCLLVVFPDGRPFDRAARRILWLVPLTAALVSVGVVLTPVGMGVFSGVVNPIQLALPTEVGRLVTISGIVLTVVLAAIAVRSLLQRYRAADQVQREQIRWFLWAGGLAVILAGGVLVLIGIFPNILDTPAGAIVLGTFSVGAALVPIACAVAIRRYRLYEIDRLISQTFVYTCLIAIVAGAYSALITGLQRVSVALTGEENDFSIVVTTLVLAVAFEPVKKRLEDFAERFREEPKEQPGTAATRRMSEAALLDEASIEAVANRVAQLMDERQSR